MATLPFDKFTQRFGTPSSGATYSYIHIPSTSHNLTILFIHGFPSSSYDWRHQIIYFSSKGYGIVAPDLLGFGCTDKPESLAEYRGKKMALEIEDILDLENIQKVHAVGHDWGSFVLSRFANYCPTRLVSLTFLSVAYMPPGELFDLQKINLSSKQLLGYELFGYWEFFDRKDAADIIKEHFESFYSMIHTSDPSVVMENMAPIGAFEKWLKTGQAAPVASYLSEQEKKIHRNIFNDEYGPALNTYRSLIANVNLEDERLARIDPMLDHPVLLITATHDKIGRPELEERRMRCFTTTNLRVEQVDTGHWPHMERKDEVNDYIESFIAKIESEVPT